MKNNIIDLNEHRLARQEKYASLAFKDVGMSTENLVVTFVDGIAKNQTTEKWWLGTAIALGVGSFFTLPLQNDMATIATIALAGGATILGVWSSKSIETNKKDLAKLAAENMAGMALLPICDIYYARTARTVGAQPDFDAKLIAIEDEADRAAAALNGVAYRPRRRNHFYQRQFSQK